MSNFGFPHLRIVTTYDVPFHDARSAVGAADLLAAARQFGTLQEAIADCSLMVGTTAVGQRELQHPLHGLEAAGSLIRAHLADVLPVAQSSKLIDQISDPSIHLSSDRSPKVGRVALLFGSEKTGLSRADLSHCHWLLRIPTRAEHRSMNLGQAVALCLYEIIRDSERAQTRAPEQERASSQAATAAELDRLTVLLLQTLEASHYIQGDANPTTLQKIRRLILRLDPSSDDTEILLGMLRQLLWKLSRTSPPDA